MMKYRAEMMAQEGRMLEIQAQMCEEQEIRETEEAFILQSRQVNRNNTLVVNANRMDEGQESSNRHRNYPEATNYIEKEQHSKVKDSVPKTGENQKGKEESTSAYEDNQKIFMKKDLKTLIEVVSENPINSISIDPQIFKSSIFKEADKLITVNTHFHSLLKAVGQEIHGQDESTNEEDNIKTEEKGTMDHLEIKPLNLSKVTLEIRDPNLNFTNEEMNWVQQLDQNLQKSLKIFVRPEFFRAVVNFRLEKISLMEFSRVMLAGRPARTYCFLMIMSNLPYFKDLTTQ